MAKTDIDERDDISKDFATEDNYRSKMVKSVVASYFKTHKPELVISAESGKIIESIYNF